MKIIKNFAVYLLISIGVFANIEEIKNYKSIKYHDGKACSTLKIVDIDDNKLRILKLNIFNIEADKVGLELYDLDLKNNEKQIKLKKWVDLKEGQFTLDEQFYYELLLKNLNNNELKMLKRKKMKNSITYNKFKKDKEIVKIGNRKIEVKFNEIMVKPKSGSELLVGAVVITENSISKKLYIKNDIFPVAFFLDGYFINNNTLFILVKEAQMEESYDFHIVAYSLN